MDRVGRYQLLEKLGEGGMGVVYKAHDPLIQRIVAVKLISGSLEEGSRLRERFFAEARAAGQLSHPNIVTVYDLGEDKGRPYFAMEFLEGRDLGRVMRSGERMSLGRRLDVIASAGQGLSYAHSRGVTHRDVKPANIFITTSGEVKVLDFGLARVARPEASELSRTRAFVGTVAYMAPEQVRGEPADARTDLFALGVVLYELLSGGRRAFETDSFATTLHRILNDAPEPLDRLDAALPAPLISIVNRALAKPREYRYQSLDEMLEDLAALRGTLPADQATGSSQARRPRFLSVDATAPTVGGELLLEAPAEGRASAGDTPRTPPPRPADSGVPAQPIAPWASEPATPGVGREVRRGIGRGLQLAAGSLLLAGLLGGGWWWRALQAPDETARATAAGVAGAGTAVNPRRLEEPEEPTVGTAGATANDGDGGGAGASPMARRAAAAPSGPAAPNPSVKPQQPQRQASPPKPERPRDEGLLMEAHAGLVEVARAKGRAESAGAERLAPGKFAEALRAEEAAGAQLTRGDYRQVSSTLRRASLLFGEAESEARAEEVRRAEEEQRRAREAQRPVLPLPAQPQAPPSKKPEPQAKDNTGLAAPAPAAPAAPGEEAGAASAERAIRELLAQYAGALESRAMARLKRIWPGLGGAQERAIADEFRYARAIGVSLSDVTTEVKGDSASVTCRRSYQLETRDGHRLESETTTVFALHRNDGGEWVIDGVRHEAGR